MLKLRFGNYEIHRVDKLNVGIYEVQPEGAEYNPKYRKLSDDGRVLRHLGKYYGGYGAAARALHEMLLAQHIEDPGVGSVAEAIELARSDMASVVDRIDAAGRASE